MKKILFSAVALVAFSSVSLGNTMELKEVKIEKSDYWACAKVASDVYNEISDLTGDADALLEANYAFDDCMGISNTPCRPPFQC